MSQQHQQPQTENYFSAFRSMISHSYGKQSNLNPDEATHAILTSFKDCPTLAMPNYTNKFAQAVANRLIDETTMGNLVFGGDGHPGFVKINENGLYEIDRSSIKNTDFYSKAIADTVEQLVQNTIDAAYHSGDKKFSGFSNIFISLRANAKPLLEEYGINGEPEISQQAFIEFSAFVAEEIGLDKTLEHKYWDENPDLKTALIELYEERATNAKMLNIGPQPQEQPTPPQIDL